MISEIKILTQRRQESGHQETQLVINWEGLSPADERAMCQAYIVSRVQARFKASEAGIPTKFTVHATEFVHHQPEGRYECRRREKKDERSEFEKILDSLNPAEKRAMIKLLETV